MHAASFKDEKPLGQERPEKRDEGQGSNQRLNEQSVYPAIGIDMHDSVDILDETEADENFLNLVI